MTQQEIQERNKQIALMLGGYKCSEISEQYELPKFMTFPPKERSNLCYTAKICLLEDMQFHLDWNWLHEAVEFIEKQKMEVSIIQNECSIIDTEKAEQEENPFMIEPISKCFDAETKKEAVFIAVSDFAKKFNNKEL